MSFDIDDIEIAQPGDDLLRKFVTHAAASETQYKVTLWLSSGMITGVTATSDDYTNEFESLIDPPPHFVHELREEADDDNYLYLSDVTSYQGVWRTNPHIVRISFDDVAAWTLGHSEGPTVPTPTHF